MTIKAVAHHLQVSWDTIKDIQATSLQAASALAKLRKLKQIAIDEIAIGKGHNYFTVGCLLEFGGVSQWLELPTNLTPTLDCGEWPGFSRPPCQYKRRRPG